MSDAAQAVAAALRADTTFAALATGAIMAAAEPSPDSPDPHPVNPHNMPTAYVADIGGIQTLRPSAIVRSNFDLTIPETAGRGREQTVVIDFLAPSATGYAYITSMRERARTVLHNHSVSLGSRSPMCFHLSDETGATDDGVQSGDQYMTLRETSTYILRGIW